MTSTAATERETQNRIVRLFQDELGYDYLGNWEDREGNSPIEEKYLTNYLSKQGYTKDKIKRAIFELQQTAQNFSDNLYTTNKQVYALLRYGVRVKTKLGENFETIKLFNWDNFSDNDFAIAEEVTIKGQKTKRPDIVIYINGIALGVIELKRGIVNVEEGILQNITNQQDLFIQSFFSTIQFAFAVNDTQGLRYGTIETEAKWYLNWKEDIQDDSRLLSDKYLLKLCNKERFLDIIYNFILFDGGIKKLPRVHQYFGVKAAQEYIHRKEGGIIWHTQGSGKSITMVILAKWILENNPNARVVLLTDRTELDKQINDVFIDVGEKIYRTSSGRDLMVQLKSEKPRLICSLIHKFGKKDVANFNKFIKELAKNPIPVAGELFVFVDECHRTQSGRLHKTMKTMLPTATFIGFTGTPLLKKDKQTSLEVFGAYIHTYKFNEGVNDKVILDLNYEARDIDQKLGSKKNIDKWFKAKTQGLNKFQQAELKKKWGTMQNVLSSQSRMQKIVADITLDFSTEPRLKNHRGNALLVSHSIYEACEYYKLFQKTAFKGKSAVITSYNPQTRDINMEDTGANTETQKQAIYNLYQEILKDVIPQANKSKTESYEDWAKDKFVKEPAQMKLLIVVSKLLTGFDAPKCSYLYLDKKMQDHGLFQAICRVNRLDTPDKEFGIIIDYRDLFKAVGKAVAVYTSELDTDKFVAQDIEVMLKKRLAAGKERLEAALESINLLCEPVAPPKDDKAYIRYFCGNPELETDLKKTEIHRNALYKNAVKLLRAYGNIANEYEEAGYTLTAFEKIKKEVEGYMKIREVVRYASREVLDLKLYEADMRHLLDTYISAKDPKVISPFKDMSLLDIIVNAGIAEGLASLPEGIRKNKELIAETIENNVRSKIIEQQVTDPAYFRKMSKLLAAIIKERKANAISYKKYLEKIAKLAKQAQAEKTSDTPDSLNTQGKRALFNLLEEDEVLALKIDERIKTESFADWRGHAPKERIIKGLIYDILQEHFIETVNKTQTSNSREPIAPYGLEEKVEQIFNILAQQTEY